MTDQREAMLELDVRMSRPNEFVQPTTTIEDLDDRLLREVFTCLDEYALACSADVNAKFKRNAHAVISSRYKHKRFHISVGECDFCELPQIGYSLESHLETPSSPQFRKIHKQFAPSFESKVFPRYPGIDRSILW